jgi:hypothetical protein
MRRGGSLDLFLDILRSLFINKEELTRILLDLKIQKLDLLVLSLRVHMFILNLHKSYANKKTKNLFLAIQDLFQ